MISPDHVDRLQDQLDKFTGILIVIGWIKVRSIKAELERNAPQRDEARTSAAASGHD